MGGQRSAVPDQVFDFRYPFTLAAASVSKHVLLFKFMLLIKRLPCR